MILTDTGPLVSLIDRKDRHHMLCMEAAAHLPTGPLLTTWPCFTEAMYLLYRKGGFSAQAALWRLLQDGRLVLHDLDSVQTERMSVLMEKYRDKPMDMADASIVAAAEHIETRRLFSLDSDFRIYCLSDGLPLDIIP